MVQSAAMVDPADDPRFVRRHPAASLFLSKVAAVLGWCGGPFVLCELWTPALGRNAAFAVTALPLIRRGRLQFPIPRSAW